MIKYKRDTSLWQEALALTVEQSEAIMAWAENAQKSKLKELEELRNDISKVFKAAAAVVENGGYVEIEAVIETVEELRAERAPLAMNHLVEDAEIELLTKGIIGEPNVMALVGYYVAKIEGAYSSYLSSVNLVIHTQMVTLKHAIEAARDN